MTKEQKAIIEELREQDRQLNAIFARREELAKICREKGNRYFDQVWEGLFADHESHHSF